MGKRLFADLHDAGAVHLMRKYDVLTVNAQFMAELVEACCCVCRAIAAVGIDVKTIVGRVGTTYVTPFCGEDRGADRGVWESVS